MPRGVKNSAKNQSSKSGDVGSAGPEPTKSREKWMAKCKHCASRRWEEAGPVGRAKLFQCQFCRRVLITTEIPMTEDPLETI